LSPYHGSAARSWATQAPSPETDTLLDQTNLEHNLIL
jgi:hypothetical protein